MISGNKNMCEKLILKTVKLIQKSSNKDFLDLFKLFQITFRKYALSNIFLGTSFVIIWGIVIWMLNNQFNEVSTEVPASWFSILNSFFIIAFAPLFSKIWESKYNPSGAFKYAWGLILLGIGFGTLAYGANSIIPGETVIKVSMY